MLNSRRAFSFEDLDGVVSGLVGPVEFDLFAGREILRYEYEYGVSIVEFAVPGLLERVTRNLRLALVPVVAERDRLVPGVVSTISDHPASTVQPDQHGQRGYQADQQPRKGSFH